MKQVFEKIKQRITIAATEACGYAALTRVVSEAEVKEILDSVVAEYNNGWIPCSERLPHEPKENPVLEGKNLELYLVTTKYGSNERDKVYPFRAFWNGVNFTDGWHILDVIAWMPLPKPYKGECEANTDILCWIGMEESGAFCEVIGSAIDNPELLEVAHN